MLHWNAIQTDCVLLGWRGEQHAHLKSEKGNGRGRKSVANFSELILLKALSFFFPFSFFSSFHWLYLPSLAEHSVIHCLLHRFINALLLCSYFVALTQQSTSSHSTVMTSEPNEKNSSVNNQTGKIPLLGHSGINYFLSLPQPHPCSAGFTGQSSTLAVSSAIKTFLKNQEWKKKIRKGDSVLCRSQGTRCCNIFQYLPSSWRLALQTAFSVIL